MTDLLKKYEKLQIDKLTLKKRIPAFRSGDTIKVTLKIIEGEKSRSQAFEGMCIARKNDSVNSKFTLRKISHGEGVERVFPLFSPNIEKIEVIRKGDVKRAKLYYLRSRTGKRARITDRDRGDEADQYDYIEVEQPATETKTIEETQVKPAETKAEDKPAETKAEDLEAKPIEEAKAEAAEDSKKEEKKAAEDNSDENK